MAKTLEEKYYDFESFVHEKLRKLIKSKGKSSKFFSNQKTLHVKEDQMFNLSGGRWLVEISNEHLIDNEGYDYGFSSIRLEEICQIIDSFKSKKK